MNDSAPTPAPADLAASAPRLPASGDNGARHEPDLLAGSFRTLARLSIVLALAALAGSAWQWYDGGEQLRSTQAEIARRLAEESGVVREVRELARTAQESVAATQARTEVLAEKFEEFESQQAALEALYQELARSRDEWEIAEVDQLITLAAQQLEVAGNVSGAALALTHAEARLARTQRPQFQSLHKAVARDLDQLRAQSHVDLPGLSSRLESLIVGADQWPLAFEVRPTAPAPAAETPLEAGAPEAVAPPLSSNPAIAWIQSHWRTLTEVAAWRAVGSDIWHEIRGLVRIQRFDRPEPALLPPEQAYFVRQNVKLRLLNARLALLTRDSLTFRAELTQARAIVGRHFDAGHPDVKVALETLSRLGATDLAVSLPTLTDSLAALRTAKLGQERRDAAATREAR